MASNFYEVVVPVMDETTESVLLSRWLKQEGDAIHRGDVICEVETEKASVEIEAYGEGLLRKRLIDAGTQIPPRTVIALIGPADAVLPNIDPYYQTSKAAPPTVSEPMPAATTGSTVTTEPSKKEVKISPRARRLAEDNGIDWATLTGSGPDDRIVEDDIKAAIQRKAMPALAPSTAAARSHDPLATRLAQAKAERVSQSWRSIPHFYMSITIDLSKVVQRKATADTSKTRLTYTDFMAEALAKTLAQHPMFNGHWQNDAFVASSEIRLGLVVQTERGLIIPAMRDLRGRTLEDMAAERKRLVQQALMGSLSATAMSEPTVTLSNVGPGHIDAFTAIISPPQVAILSVGSVQPRPMVDNGTLVVRTAAVVTLGADHRAIDGRQSAAFLETLKAMLES